MALSCIKSSGNIITDDFCEALAREEKARYIKDSSFDIKKVDEHIATTFELLRERWEEIRKEVIEDKMDNSTLRRRWIIPLFEMLGFEPKYIASNIKSDAGQEYHIPYVGWDGEDAPKIHLVHSNSSLDKKDNSSRTHKNKSPHDLLQQYLNTSADQWGLLANGKKIRLLRDFFHSITKGFLEFDLEGIFETANSREFRILFRTLHRSRFEGQSGLETESTCLLEEFHQKSRETGIKVGDNLRKQVVETIETLGNGFAESLNPDDFSEQEVKAFYSEILHLIYRVLFLLYAEQKGWLPIRNETYARTYSINALREMALRGDYSHDNETDLWEGLKITFRLVAKGYIFPNGDKVNAFGGQLFSDEKIQRVKKLKLKNKHLLKAIEALCYFEEDKLKNRINYATLAIDELGSVYESLLDYHPSLLKADDTIENKTRRRGKFFLDDRSMERKSTGSYYTDSRLVAQLIESALVPVIENALKDKNTPELQEQALLSLKVADIACGSGAFLIAALEKLGERLAVIRMGEDERPTEEQLREAKRDVLLHCIYGVDLNPMALELAKFSLWITASMPDMPLTFLDHKLKCGNSLIGATPELIKAGIPAEAYNPVTLDDKEVCKELKKQVRQELKEKEKGVGIQTSMDFDVKVSTTQDERQEYKRLLQAEQETADEVAVLEEEYHQLHRNYRYHTDWRLADTWTAAFFIQKDDPKKDYPTNISLEKIRNGEYLSDDLEREVQYLAQEYRFFHFHLEFPEVFENGGFDCVLGNPPWEVWELKEKEFFKSKNEKITSAKSGFKRKELISKLRTNDLILFDLFQSEKLKIEKTGIFLNHSGSYTLTSHGKLNLYSIFCERSMNLINKHGRQGVIVPSGIATDDNTKYFFQHIVKKRQLVSLFDFENREGLFPPVDRRFKFCLLTLSGGKNIYPFDFLFFATNPSHLLEKERHFSLSSEELFLINPNTGTCPIFRNKSDAELVKKIYSQFSVLLNEKEEHSEWGIKFKVMLNMTTSSNLFKTYSELKEAGHKLNGNIFNEDNVYLPLYEGKMFHYYDHRYASVLVTDNVVRAGQPEKTSIELKKNKMFEPLPRFWVLEEKIRDKSNWDKEWFFGYKKVTSPTNARTFIGTILPLAGIADSILIIFSNYREKSFACLTANLSSFVFDYIVRQKIGGTNLTFNYLKQIPVVSPKKYSSSLEKKIIEMVLRLNYTSFSLKKFAADLGYDGEPFPWDVKERYYLRCELDAIYGHLYNLTRKEFEYIINTFTSVNRKDLEKYGSYRTKETILQYFDEMQWVREEVEKMEQEKAQQ